MDTKDITEDKSTVDVVVVNVSDVGIAGRIGRMVTVGCLMK